MAEKAEIVITAKDQTASGFSSATANIKNASSEVVALGTRLAGIGVAITAAAEIFEKFNPAPVLEQADALAKLSQRTGIAVETLSAYQYAAKLADVSNEDLDTSLKKLNLNIAAAARGQEEQAGAFRTIGVSVKDASGNVRSADKVFADIADRFHGYTDGANKVAIANAVGGKSFEKLIPMLNDGAKGLEDSRIELEKFGGVISTDLAQKAQAFRDNLTKLEVAGQKLKIFLAGEFIDTLVETSDKFVDAAKNGDLFWTVLGKLNSLSASAIGAKGADALFGTPTELDKVTESARHLNQVVAATQALLKADPGNTDLAKKLASVSAQAATANRNLDALRKGVASNTGDFTRADHDRTRVPTPKPPPGLPDPAALAAERALQKQLLDGNLKRVQASLEREEDLFKFSQSRLDEIYAHGEVSIDAYYDAKNKAQLDSLAAQSKAFDEEIAALRDHQKLVTTSKADKQEDENKINEIIAKQAKVYREAGQAAEAAETQRARAAKEFSDSLRGLDAQLAELNGDKYGSELLRNAQTFEDAAKLLSHGGVDDGRAKQLKTLLDLQTALTEQQRQYQLLTARAQVTEESFLLKAEQGGLSREEIEKTIGAQRQDSLRQLDEIIAKTEALNGKTDEQKLALDQLKLAREKAFAVADPGLTRFNELAANGAQDIASAFEDAVVEGGKLSDVINSLDKQLAHLLLNDLVTKPLEGAITNFIKGIGSGGTGGGATTLVTGILGKIGLGSKPGGAGGDAPDVAGLAALDSAAAKSAADLDDSTQSLVNSTDKASGALGGLPGIVGRFFSYVQTLFSSSSSSSSSGGGGFGGLIGSLLGSGGSAAGGSASNTAASDEGLELFFHAGGLVTAGGDRRMVSSSVFASAPRYHGGGLAGLSPDEVPAILMGGPKGKREEVLRADDPRHRDNGGGMSAGDTYNIGVNATPGMSRATAMQQGADIYAGIALARKRNG